MRRPSSGAHSRDPLALPGERCTASGIRRPWGYRTSIRQRIGPELDVHGARHRALAAFLEPGRAVAVGAPQPAALPAGVGIVDPPVEALGLEAERRVSPYGDHLAVLQRHEAVAEIGGRHRAVLAKS